MLDPLTLLPLGWGHSHLSADPALIFTSRPQWALSLMSLSDLLLFLATAFFFFFEVGVELLYNVALVSAIQ